MESVIVKNPALNLAQYHAYVACIECRVNYLMVDRNYNGFFNNVFPYFSLLFSRDVKNATVLEEKERKMWGFAWDTQRQYLEQIKDKSIGNVTSKTGNLATLCFDTQSVHGCERVETIKYAADALFKLDKQPCDLLERVNALPDNIALTGLNAKNDKKAVMLLRELDLILPVFEELAGKKAEASKKTDDLGKKPIYPAFLGSELMAWASHLGTAVVQFAEGNILKKDGKKTEGDVAVNTANEEFSKGNEHLRRAVFDVYKDILIDLLRDKARVKHRVSKDFWERLIFVRRHDHDGGSSTSVIQGYGELIAVLLEKLGYIDEPFAQFVSLVKKRIQPESV